MEHQITPEIAMAIQKGERDYAYLLSGMELVRPAKDDFVHVDNLSANQKLGYDNLERRLRDAA